MNAILQFSTGVFGHPLAMDISRVRARLEHMLDILPVRGLIYGWGEKPGLFSMLGDLARAHGVETYLWLPVFADVQHPLEADPMQLWESAHASGMHPIAGEEFEFVCPGSRRNRESVLKSFDALTREFLPDGVFLDRIRYPSASGGDPQRFGCLCAACRERIRAQGADIRRMEARVRASEPGIWSVPDSLSEGVFHFPDPDMETLSRIRRETITEAIHMLAGAFHAGGLRVGVDTFAPALADLVGQDLHAILPEVDFVKPMMYFRTWAPAGIPYEADGYGPAVSGALQRLWGEDITRKSSMKVQLQSLSAWKDIVWPGLEINRVPGFCEISAGDVDSSVRLAAGSGCETVVLSWNTLQATDEDLQAAADVMKTL